MDQILCLRKADTFWSRCIGLMGKHYLSEKEGVFFPNCRAVHTFFMKIPIMVIFCDRKGKILKVIPCLNPWSWAYHPQANMVVEIQANHPFCREQLQQQIYLNMP